MCWCRLEEKYRADELFVAALSSHGHFEVRIQRVYNYFVSLSARLVESSYFLELSSLFSTSFLSDDILVICTEVCGTNCVKRDCFEPMKQRDGTIPQREGCSNIGIIKLSMRLIDYSNRGTCTYIYRFFVSLT